MGIAVHVESEHLLFLLHFLFLLKTLPVVPPPIPPLLPNSPNPTAVQVGGAGIKAVVHQRAPMTMGEVLEVMLAKSRVEAEDAQVGAALAVLCWLC